jgi:hypothetical protein
LAIGIQRWWGESGYVRLGKDEVMRRHRHPDIVVSETHPDHGRARDVFEDDAKGGIGLGEPAQLATETHFTNGEREIRILSMQAEDEPMQRHLTKDMVQLPHVGERHAVRRIRRRASGIEL